MTESFLELVRRRNSIRSYGSAPVPEELVLQVLEAGRLAPSACNLQPWKFIVVRDPAQRAKIEAAYGRPWIAEAPVIVVVCSEPGSAWVRQLDRKNHADIDVAIAVDHMILCATSLGLGSCWVCAFDPVQLREALHLPPQLSPVALFPLGYVAESGRPKDRKSLEEVVFYDRYVER